MTVESISPDALSRFEYQAADEQSDARRRLALAQPAAVQGTVPAGLGTGAGHPSAHRLNSSAWQGFTNDLNRAQAAQADADVWVTVPVDKVTIAPGGGHAIAPVYASTKGYRPRPGESAGSVPPTVAVGR